ncbi:Glutathione s-transferase [Thalictrum thalictroides]|uniref:Glutathione S-transferase n=1 Tax=Thalictrum thalictroides TaxID=46969 RepID=A0A7J6XBR0_THATH|nr:Glutathione s-transferase [Thalictrum thalictroides]
MRVRIALNLKNIEYEYLEQNYAVKSELLLQSNPVYKKVPVLIHNDQPICESLIIVHYIDEVFMSDPSLLPSDPFDRAVTHLWATYIDDKWYGALFEVMIGQTDEEKGGVRGLPTQRFCSNAVVKDLMPETEKLMEFAKMLISG